MNTETFKQVNYEVAEKIINYISKVDTNAKNWYIGIATYPENRLFDDHNVSKNSGAWIYEDAGSERSARDTERHLLRKFTFQGGTSGGKTPHYVYAYKLTKTTRE